MKGVVAAGHPLTAQAGADVLRAGGNAVDAAVAAVLMSFVAESPLTGPGAGGFMVVHARGESHVLDFFVAAPGLGLDGREPSELVPVDVHFSEDAVQRFNVGPASCGAYGTTLGLVETLERFGSARLGDLTGAPARAARDGIEVVPMQAFLFQVLHPILTLTPECASIYAPEGRLLEEGDTIRLPELGDLLDRLGAEGPAFLYSGDVAAAVSDWVLERGGVLSREDLGSYEVIERDPARVTYRGREVITNPPPSSGGILIADALGILERLERPHDPYMLAEVIASTNRARDEEFLAGLATEGFLERFLAKKALDSVATDVRSRLGNTTHISVMDAEGSCASVTCSNGSCSGVVVPGTGMHLNNMLGEQDLNPLGFHRHPRGARVPSMMAPTVVLREGRPEIAIGSAGSNRIRSAILQTVLGVVDHGLPAQEAVSAPRIHVEERQVDAEPGVDETALERLERAAGRCAAGRSRTSSSAAPRRWRATPTRAASPAEAIRAGAASQRSSTKASLRRGQRPRLAQGAAQQPPPAALHRFTRPKPKLGSRPAGPRSSTAASSRLRIPRRCVRREQLPEHPVHARGVRRGHRRAGQLAHTAAGDRGEHVHAGSRDLNVRVRVRELTRARRCGRSPRPRRPRGRRPGSSAWRRRRCRRLRSAPSRLPRRSSRRSRRRLQRGRVAAAEAHRDHLRAARVRPVDAVGHVGGRCRSQRAAERLADRRAGALKATPATPVPLFALAAIVPATWVPCMLSSAQAVLDRAAIRRAREAQSDGLAAQVRVGLVDAGVDDADLHAAAGGEGAEAGGVPALGGVDVGVGVSAGLARCC